MADNSDKDRKRIAATIIKAAFDAEPETLGEYSVKAPDGADIGERIKAVRAGLMPLFSNMVVEAADNIDEEKGSIVDILSDISRYAKIALNGSPTVISKLHGHIELIGIAPGRAYPHDEMIGIISELPPVLDFRAVYAIRFRIEPGNGPESGRELRLDVKEIQPMLYDRIASRRVDSEASGKPEISE